MNWIKIIEGLKATEKHYRHLLSLFVDEIELMPEGSLNSKQIHGQTYFYHYVNDGNGKGKQRYITEGESRLKTALKRKLFLQLSIKRLKISIKALETFLKIFQPYDPDDILALLPEAFKEIDYNVHKERLCSDWSKEDYERSDLYPEGLIHGTVNGLKVRSKSEAIIAGLLEVNNVPFRYEAALNLGNKAYYPDFTIMRPRDNKILYWEHFGMADDEGYSYSMEKKLSVYRKHGIVPWNQLITTYEVEKGSMDARDIQGIIDAFLL
ncbi:hypothetical protein MASR2M70_04780 [Bacillota bacterium]